MFYYSTVSLFKVKPLKASWHSHSALVSVIFAPCGTQHPAPLQIDADPKSLLFHCLDSLACSLCMSFCQSRWEQSLVSIWPIGGHSAVNQNEFSNLSCTALSGSQRAGPCSAGLSVQTISFLCSKLLWSVVATALLCSLLSHWRTFLRIAFILWPISCIVSWPESESIQFVDRHCCFILPHIYRSSRS